MSKFIPFFLTTWKALPLSAWVAFADTSMFTPLVKVSSRVLGTDMMFGVECVCCCFRCDECLGWMQLAFMAY
jgi:hypothetical protein